MFYLTLANVQALAYGKIIRSMFVCFASHTQIRNKVNQNDSMKLIDIANIESNAFTFFVIAVQQHILSIISSIISLNFISI